MCLLFHPSLFWGCPALVRTYVTPVLKNYGLEYVHLPAAQEEGREAEACFSRIIRLKELAPGVPEPGCCRQLPQNSPASRMNSLAASLK